MKEQEALELLTKIFLILGFILIGKALFKGGDKAK